MGSKLYAVSETGICPACGYRRDSREHLHHVPRNRWPENLTQHKKRVVVNGLVMDEDDPRVAVAVQSLTAVITPAPVIDNQTIYVEPERPCGWCDGVHSAGHECSVFPQPAPEGWEPDIRISCECGYIAKSAQALTMHRRRSKAHRVDGAAEPEDPEKD